MNPIVSGTGSVVLAAPSHVHASPPGSLTASLAAEIGAAYRIVSSGPHTLQGFEATVAAAGAELAMYTKTGALASATALPDAAYARKIGGARKYDSTWRVYTAQPDHPAWQAYHAKQLAALPTWVEAVFSDTALLTYTQGGKPAKPPAYTTLYTLAEWLRLEKTNLDAWQSATGKRFIVNGLSTDSLPILTPGVGMIENAFASQKGVLPSADVWLRTMRLIVDAQATGWTPWVYVKLFNQPATAYDAWRRLVVPSMLLGDAGSLLFHLGPSEGGAPIWQTLEHRQACYKPRIGAPIESVESAMTVTSGGYYSRTYAGGCVIVNPQPTGVSVQLDDTASPIPVDAQSGVILRREVTYTPIA